MKHESFTRKLCILLMIATEAFADPRPNTALGLIGRSLDPVGIRSDSALRAFAKEYVFQASQAAFNSPSSLTQVGAIDSTMEAAGPIFLSHPGTLGQGKTNVSLLGQTSLTDETFEQPGLLLIANQEQFPTEIDYRLKLRMANVALAISHGLTDNLDVSLLLMMAHSELEIDTGRKVPGSSKVRSTETIENTGFGDTTLRLKYGLPDLGPLESALGLESQFPTGEADDLLGTGDWWLTPTLAGHIPFGRGDLTFNAGLDFDLSDSKGSQAFYGVGGSYVLIPKRLIGVLEFMGRSDLDAHISPNSTDVFYVFPDGSIKAAPLFGFGVDRKDYFDLAFGIRFVIVPGIMGFAAGVWEINDASLHGDKIIPTLGLGGNF